jgi:hypothetical protein
MIMKLFQDDGTVAYEAYVKSWNLTVTPSGTSLSAEGLVVPESSDKSDDCLWGDSPHHSYYNNTPDATCNCGADDVDSSFHGSRCPLY